MLLVLARGFRPGIRGLELMEGVWLSWAPREAVERTLRRAKESAVEQWEKAGSGPTVEAAVIELTEEQFKAVRHMARDALEAKANALLQEMDSLLKAARRRDPARVKGWLRDMARRYQALVDASLALGIEPSIMERLKEKWKEVLTETGRP